jgi:hypothetical protein
MPENLADNNILNLFAVSPLKVGYSCLVPVLGIFSPKPGQIPEPGMNKEYDSIAFL